MAEIHSAIAANVVPIVVCKGNYYQIRAAVHTISGYYYNMRECIHCTLERVQVLMKTTELVAILAKPGYTFNA
jgi:hypothetical protein